MKSHTSAGLDLTPTLCNALREQLGILSSLSIIRGISSGITGSCDFNLQEA